MKRVALTLIVLLLIPWVIVMNLLLSPEFLSQVSAGEIQRLAPAIAVLIVYPVILVGLASIIGIPMLKEQRNARKTRQGTEPPSCVIVKPLSDAERREREKRRKRAQAGGDIAMALMLIDNKRK